MKCTKLRIEDIYVILFDRAKHRLDDIYFETMITNESKNFSKASVVTQKLLILSHGQATVGRGFSLNREISTDNLSEHNLRAKRIIKDHIKHVEDLQKVTISRGLLNSIQGAYQKYQNYTDEQHEIVLYKCMDYYYEMH